MTKYVRNVEHNGVEIYFDGIPESSIREELKNNGFRWHRAKKCWYSYASSYNMKFAMQICNKCNSGFNGYKLYDDFPRKKPIEEWEEKSIYRKYGYTVSREEGLSDAKRRNILKYMMLFSTLNDASFFTLNGAASAQASKSDAF